MARRSFAAIAVAALAGCTGCVTSTEVPLEFDDGPAPTLEFPDAAELETWGDYHNVQLVIERSEAVEPHAVLPRYRGDTEYYDFGEDHQLEFRQRFFFVGTDRNRHTYPASDNAVLHVFLQRPGDWAFRYRGVEIIVEAESPWKPAVLWSPVFSEDSGPRSVRRRRGRSRRIFEMRIAGRLVREAVRVGRHEIVYEPGKPYLVINGERWLVDRLGVRFRLDRRGGVKLGG